MNDKSTLDDLLHFVGSIDQQSLKYEIKVLRAIKAWAINQVCDFAEGDKVEMTDSLDMTTLNGWAGYAEAMAPGAMATVQRIGFNEHYGYWYADIIFDREWSLSTDGATRYWHGPIADTPDGFKPPSKFDQETYADGRKHTFAMPVRHLRRCPGPVPAAPEEGK